MSDTVRVPEPVKQRLEREHDERGISRGAIIEDWMQKADAYDELKSDFKQAMKTRSENPSLTGGRTD